MLLPLAIQLAEAAVAVAVGMLLPILLPDQLQCQIAVGLQAVARRAVPVPMEACGSRFARNRSQTGVSTRNIKRFSSSGSRRPGLASVRVHLRPGAMFPLSPGSTWTCPQLQNFRDFFPD